MRYAYAYKHMTIRLKCALSLFINSFTAKRSEENRAAQYKFIVYRVRRPICVCIGIQSTLGLGLFLVDTGRVLIEQNEILMRFSHSFIHASSMYKNILSSRNERNVKIYQNIVFVLPSFLSTSINF